MDTTRETNIGRYWLKSLVLAAISVGILVASWYGVQIEVDIYSARAERSFRNLSFIMLPAFTVFSVFVIFRLFVPVGTQVRLSSAGFTDLRAGRSEIPWNEITNVVRRGEFVTDVKARFCKVLFAVSYPADTQIV